MDRHTAGAFGRETSENEAETGQSNGPLTDIFAVGHDIDLGAEGRLGVESEPAAEAETVAAARRRLHDEYG